VSWGQVSALLRDEGVDRILERIPELNLLATSLELVAVSAG
jgi:hypothetical protein